MDIWVPESELPFLFCLTWRYQQEVPVRELRYNDATIGVMDSRKDIAST